MRIELDIFSTDTLLRTEKLLNENVQNAKNAKKIEDKLVGRADAFELIDLDALKDRIATKRQ